MSDYIDPSNNSANQQNSNKGTVGTNKQYDQGQGNRGKQLNPNQKTIKTFAPESGDTPEIRKFKAHTLLANDPNLAFELYPELRSEFNEDEFQDEYF